jgi:hypothetical protein
MLQLMRGAKCSMPANPSHHSKQKHRNKDNTNMNAQWNELAREELTALYSRTCPQGKVVLVGVAVDNEGGKAWQHRLYTVLIGGESFTWRAGMGIKGAPDCAEVLARCCAEGVGAECSFEQWCGDCGYENTDSRAALATYLACQDGVGRCNVLRGTI